jgi:hypothetical protein
MYILAGLSPPEEVTGGVWYNANQGYDTALVQAICQVLLKRTFDLVSYTVPKLLKLTTRRSPRSATRMRNPERRQFTHSPKHVYHPHTRY